MNFSRQDVDINYVLALSVTESLMDEVELKQTSKLNNTGKNIVFGELRLEE